jgi:GTP-sensing pleiotropic transcriptional regulator CodY
MKTIRQRVNQLEKMLEPKEEPISYEIVIHGGTSNADYIIKRTEFKDGKETVLEDHTVEYEKERERIHAEMCRRIEAIPEEFQSKEVASKEETKSEQRSQKEAKPKEDEPDYQEKYVNVFPLKGSLQDILMRW